MIIEIAREQINGWNRICEASRGTAFFFRFCTEHDYKFKNKWYPLCASCGIRNMYKEDANERFYAKKVKGNTYIYWEKFGEVERFYVTETMSEFFGINFDF